MNTPTADMIYVVEQPAVVRSIDGVGVKRGVARVYVDSEERAREIVGQATPGLNRTFRQIPIEVAPQSAQDAIRKARAERANIAQ